MEIFNIAVDLLWVKHGKVGGIETYVLNLLDGISKIDKNNNYILIVSKDNRFVFDKYSSFPNFTLHECNVNSDNVIKTILWENLHLDRIVRKCNSDICFVPYYRKPCLRSTNKYIIVLHDLQALHFPYYFSKLKYQWLKNYWRLCLNSATHIVAISKFVKDDIIRSYSIPQEKISVIYNPVLVYGGDNATQTLQKFGLEENKYLYTISSLHKHKNLLTILKSLLYLRKKGIDLKLVITGVKGSSVNELTNFIKINKLGDNCIYTGYISDKEKFDLLKSCRIFLFPSVFEGFGMPPIESLLVGKKVITTRCTCIPEITCDKAIYVENPYDYKEWAQKIIDSVNYTPLDSSSLEMLREKYSPINIAKQYIDLIEYYCNN